MTTRGPKSISQGKSLKLYTGDKDNARQVNSFKVYLKLGARENRPGRRKKRQNVLFGKIISRRKERSSFHGRRRRGIEEREKGPRTVKWLLVGGRKNTWGTKGKNNSRLREPEKGKKKRFVYVDGQGKGDKPEEVRWEKEKKICRQGKP